MTDPSSDARQVKVLIGIPTYPGHAYCREEFVAGTKQLVHGSPAQTDVLVVWNGNQRPSGFPQDWTRHIYQPKVGERPLDILAAKQNVIRDYMLQGDYTHLFLLESDNIPPAHTLEHFLAHDVDIVSAVYFIKSTGVKGFRIPENHPRVQEYREMFPNAPTHEEGFIMRAETIPSVWGLVDGVARMWDVNDALPQRGLVKVYAAGVGSVLMTRRVLEQVQFRVRDNKARTQQFTDFVFYHDAYKAGFTTYVDTDTWAEHLHNYDMDTDVFRKWFTVPDLEPAEQPSQIGYKADADLTTHTKRY